MKIDDNPHKDQEAQKKACKARPWKAENQRRYGSEAQQRGADKKRAYQQRSSQAVHGLSEAPDDIAGIGKLKIKLGLSVFCNV